MELAMLEELEEQDMLPPDLYSRKVDVSAELYELLVNEVIFWLQQSHERWLLKGDLNTDYFHKIAKGRKRKNTIHSMNVGDVTIEGTDNILRHATDFYKSLFGPSPGNLFLLDPEIWGDNERLDEADNLILTRPFSEEEVKIALFSMNSNRAPGPDNIPAEFYQHCWEIVKNEVMLLFEWFHDNKLDVQILNYGIITLVPKTK